VEVGRKGQDDPALKALEVKVLQFGKFGRGGKLAPHSMNDVLEDDNQKWPERKLFEARYRMWKERETPLKKVCQATLGPKAKSPGAKCGSKMPCERHLTKGKDEEDKTPPSKKQRTDETAEKQAKEESKKNQQHGKEPDKFLKLSADHIISGIVFLGPKTKLNPVPTRISVLVGRLQVVGMHCRTKGFCGVFG